VAELGLSRASKQAGIPVSTLFDWKKQAQIHEGAEWPPLPEPEPDEDGSVEELVTALEEGEPKGKRVARVYTPSQRAEALKLADAKGVTAAANALGISRFSIYEWRRKVKLAERDEGASPTSGPDPRDIEARRDAEVLKEWRKHPGLGPSQISNQLRRRGIKIAVGTTRRVMEDAGYRPPRVRREGHDERFEAVRPNHMWHADFVQRWIGRASTFTLILLDDHSRFVVGHGVDESERADMVIKTFEDAVARHGKPEMLMHDKGSAFWSWKGISRFTRLLEELDVQPIVAKHKQWNGKLENFNGNIQKELFNQHHFSSVAEMKHQLAAHLRWYNRERTHHALGGLLVPADRYYGRVEEVLARIEGGHVDDSDDMLQLNNRLLDLFKVTSRGGKTEIWLMGQRLMG
jgi:transposase InsO family protein